MKLAAWACPDISDYAMSYPSGRQQACNGSDTTPLTACLRSRGKCENFARTFAALQRSLGPTRQVCERNLGPTLFPAMSDDTLAGPGCIVEQNDTSVRETIEQTFGSPSHERMHRPRWTIDDEQINGARNIG